MKEEYKFNNDNFCISHRVVCGMYEREVYHRTKLRMFCVYTVERGRDFKQSFYMGHGKKPVKMTHEHGGTCEHFVLDCDLLGGNYV